MTESLVQCALKVSQLHPLLTHVPVASSLQCNSLVSTFWLFVRPTLFQNMMNPFVLKDGNYHISSATIVPTCQMTRGSDAGDIDISTHISEPASAILSEQQKYRKAFKVAQNLCQQLSTFGMRDFNEGIEVLQSVASLWDGGKKVFVREATGITTVQYTVHYVTVIVFLLLHCSVFPHFV